MNNIIRYQLIPEYIVEKFIYKITSTTISKKYPKIIKKYHLKAPTPVIEEKDMVGPPSLCKTIGNYIIGYLHVSNLYKSLTFPQVYQIGHTYERYCHTSRPDGLGGFEIHVNKIDINSGKLLKVKTNPDNIIWTYTKRNIMHCNKITILEEC